MERNKPMTEYVDNYLEQRQRLIDANAMVNLAAKS
jgi:hypothetical protein